MAAVVQVAVGREGNLVAEGKEGTQDSLAVQEGTGQDMAQGSQASGTDTGGKALAFRVESGTGHQRTGWQAAEVG